MTTTRKILLSAGHSGEWEGFVQTPGKRSPEIGPPTMGYYEGEMNRTIASLLAARLQRQGVSAVLLNPSPMSVPESAQVTYARDCVKHFGADNVLILAIHNNAAGVSGWNDANGATVFIKRNSAPENMLPARQLLTAWTQATGLATRGIKEKNFNILMGAPLSCLMELSFMTNKNDCLILSQQYDKGIAAICDVLEGWARS